MIPNLGKDFSLYSKLIVVCEKSTQRILSYIKTGEVDKCNKESCHRERLIEAIKEDYPKMLSLMKDRIYRDKSSIKKVKTWGEWMQGRLKKINRQDIEIMSLLKQEKESVKKQLVAIYKVKQKIKSYNCDSLPK